MVATSLALSILLAPASAAPAEPKGEEALRAELVAPSPAEAAPARRPAPQAIPDAWNGQYTRQVVFGDPFATSAARHRPYEPDPVHAQFDDTPQRWRYRRAWVGPGWGWGLGLGWGLGYGYYGPGLGYGGYWGGGAGFWGGVAGFGLGLGIGAVLW